MGLDLRQERKTFEAFTLTPDQKAKLDELARTKHPAWIEFFESLLVNKRYYEGAVELLRKLKERGEEKEISIYDQDFAQRVAQWMNGTVRR